jgi:protein-L-isoaspartate(D-aspartate) O-methyltransferase
LIDAIRRVPRAAFVPDYLAKAALSDGALPIGCEQTISQPYIVAKMVELLEVKPTHRVLEVGTGSGYHAAILSQLVSEVFSVEIITSLATSASDRLTALGYGNIQVRTGDGATGWPEHAPFDRICVTAAPAQIPEALGKQLRVGGRMVSPVGVRDQRLVVWDRTSAGFKKLENIAVRFVPMVDGNSEITGEMG